MDAGRKAAQDAKASEKAGPAWTAAEAKRADALKAMAGQDYQSAGKLAAEARTSYDKAKSAATAPPVSAAQQKAIDARKSMEDAKAACAKVPKPGLPHHTWAKNSEQKAVAAYEKSDWANAEKSFTDARNFYNEAAKAGKK